MDQPIWNSNPIQRHARGELLTINPSQVFHNPFLLQKVSRLLTTDVKAINHILFNSYDFPRPDELSYVFRKLFGLGALSGAYFRRQLYDCIKGFLLSKEMSIRIR